MRYLRSVRAVVQRGRNLGARHFNRISVRIGLAIAGLVVLPVITLWAALRMGMNAYADEVRQGLFRSSMTLVSALQTRSGNAAGRPQLRSPSAWTDGNRGLCVVFYDGHGERNASVRCDTIATPQHLSVEAQERATAHLGQPQLLETRRLAAHTAMLVALDPNEGGGYLSLHHRTAGKLEDLRLKSLVTVATLMTMVVIVFALLATWAVVRRIRASIYRTQLVVKRIADGDLDERLHWGGDDEIGALALNFNRMAERLREMVTTLRAENARRRALFAALSHELNTPLTAVLGYLESLQLDDIDSDGSTRKRYVGIAYTQAKALAALVEDLDTVSRLDVGDLTLRPVPTRLELLVKHEVEALTPHAAASGVQLAIRNELLGEAVGDVAEVDPLRVAQVLRNLLDNAIRYSPAGRDVLVAIRASTEGVQVAVCDQGPGIPDHIRKHIGQWMLRADPSRTRRTGGRGLGLSIARGLVRAHGGKLEICTQQGAGTTVSFSLPRHCAPPSPVQD